MSLPARPCDSRRGASINQNPIDRSAGSFVTYHVIFTACSLCDKIFDDGKMADASNGPGTLESDLLETRKRLGVLDKNYRNLKGLSQRGERVVTLRTIWQTQQSALGSRFVQL